MSIYIPFTYRVTCLVTNQHYYGVRHAKGCQPADLWTTYFTSSKVIDSLIRQHGKEAFKVEIRKTFSTKDKALNWEERVLHKINAAKNNKYLNRSNGSKNFHCTEHSEETKIKIGKSVKGKLAGEKHPSYGNTGNKNIRAIYIWTAIDPEKNITEWTHIQGPAGFIESHPNEKWDQGTISKVANGRRNHHWGWSFSRRLKKEINLI